jgi:hypothetical protein
VRSGLAWTHLRPSRAQPVHAGLIPEEVVERPEGGLEAGYEAEYLVEPEHIKEGLEV